MIEMWQGCYDDGWQGVIVPEAFAHPAKMSYGLLKRILDHAKGRLNEGDVIVDPFGGIGSTGILGAYEGYQVVCVELEQKFVDLAEQNFELHKDAWVEFGNPFPIILQGDSRRLCEVIEKADCIVSSLPFSTPGCQPAGNMPSTPIRSKIRKMGLEKKAGKEYGQTPGQLGSMKPGNIDMVVSSPPYAESLKPETEDQTQRKQERIAKSKTIHDGRKLEKPSPGKAGLGGGYGISPGNLGNLKSGDVDCVISSPPYEGTHVVDGEAAKLAAGGNARKIPDGAKSGGVRYGNTNGNLGQEQGDTFWQAAKTIVEQCFQILKPGGHAIWVVKSFVRNKKIVDFPGDWQRLCESVGFKTVCIHHAMLVKETKHQTLFGDTEVKRKERKSFFRRLAESKGSPRIDYEVVLCMNKSANQHYC
jgi:16S rRNA G966 N2-methylase RsmD